MSSKTLMNNSQIIAFVNRIKLFPKPNWLINDIWYYKLRKISDLVHRASQIMALSRADAQSLTPALQKAVFMVVAQKHDLSITNKVLLHQNHPHYRYY